ncbi:hypothetical protein RAS12_13220 [Achromobacter seleniivolatilans]|uniref:Uncharacterized protein n=1 Tax=Achromobacter seleniivolatilans TaxID=3047478 RepID=A0ABY9M8J0_9BURK|nr:hypothetical protein [Achromobacter sp. R39]WMD23285.1 hypothetical protein RAS12_13220 [Achromobacter sp. R39]
MTEYINTPPVREIWLRALPALADVKNGDYLTIGRLQEAFGLGEGKKLRDVLAAGERDGLLEIDRGAMPTTYRATFILERGLRAVREDWTD